jgi:hypothetical protein
MKMIERTLIKNGKNLITNLNKVTIAILNLNVTYLENYICSIDPFRKEALIRDFNELYQKIYDKEKYINL